jgi:hypothetical protein
MPPKFVWLSFHFVEELEWNKIEILTKLEV